MSRNPSSNEDTWRHLAGTNQMDRDHLSLLMFRLMWITVAICIHIEENERMKTVQMTLDEDLVEAVDRAVKRLGTNRSAFTREALRNALSDLRVATLERRHREGYARYPVEPGEFGDWESEHVWGSE